MKWDDLVIQEKLNPAALSELGQQGRDLVTVVPPRTSCRTVSSNARCRS